MSWEDELREAAGVEPAAEEDAVPSGTAEVVVGGRTVNVPAPLTVAELLDQLGGTPADTYYICVSASGAKLRSDDELSPGERYFLIPVRVDG